MKESMDSFHDYHIYGYEVDSLNRAIKFKMAWPIEGEKAQITYLKFCGVQGYELKNDSMVSIVLDFEEMDIEQFLDEYGNTIQEAYKQNGAYGSWVHDLSMAKSYMEEHKVKAVVLSSSIGIEGWVLANSVEVESA